MSKRNQLVSFASLLIFKSRISNYCLFLCLLEVDHIYIQSLNGIKDLHETGINETNFHEVCKTTMV